MSGTSQISFEKSPFYRLFTTIMLVAMCVQIVPIEGTTVSSIKVVLMASTPIILAFKTPYVTKPLFYGLLFWLTCYFTALFQNNMRFSTIGYLGLFISSYIVFYNFIHLKVFSLEYFTKILRTLIIAYGITLLLQQIAMLWGIHNLPIINLVNQDYLELTKLPSLSIEPSHSARLLTAMMISYIRCTEITDKSSRISFDTLFSKKHRLVSILFLWTMLTMGSGTAFLGLGILSLYFIQLRTIAYFVPLFIGLFYLGQNLGLKQLERLQRSFEATLTGNITDIREADGSASARIVPLINTFTKTNLTDKESWFGKGTLSSKEALVWWKVTTKKTIIVEQYGLVGLISSLFLIYCCAIRKLISIETLIFVILSELSLGNLALVWGTIMIFTATRFFYENQQYQFHKTSNSFTFNKPE